MKPVFVIYYAFCEIIPIIFEMVCLQILWNDLMKYIFCAGRSVSVWRGKWNSDHE